MLVSKVATLAAAHALVSGAACASPHAVIRIDGSPGVMPIVAELVTAYRAGGERVDIMLASGMGSSARIDAVARGDIDVAMASHGVVADDLAARGLVAHEIARTAVVFAVHAGVPVRSLTRDQVCEILSGRAANWNRYTAGDRRIVPLMRPDAEVDAEVAIAAVACLRDLTLGGAVRVIERPDSMAAALASAPGAFGVTSMSMVQASGGRIAALALDSVAPTSGNVASGAYALTRRAILVTRADPSAAVVRFLEFARSSEGQRVIRASGAVPVAAARFMQ